jgi:Tol biopolymer transport system component
MRPRPCAGWQREPNQPERRRSRHSRVVNRRHESAGLIAVVLVAGVVAGQAAAPVGASAANGEASTVSSHGRAPVLIISGDTTGHPLELLRADGRVTKSALLQGRHTFNIDVSPNGRTLAYEHEQGLASIVYGVPVRGGESTVIAPGSQPAWSPDGTALAVSADTYDIGAYEHKAVHTFPPPQIYTVTPGGVPAIFVNDPHHWDDEPSWSPDGKSLVYQRSGQFGDDGGPHDGLFISDGTTTRRLIGDSHGRGAFDPAWSPDGRHIAFDRDLRGHHGLGTADVWEVDVDGSHLHRVTRDAQVDDLAPQWSPNGSALSFVVATPGDERSGVAVMRPTSRHYCLVDTEWGGVANASWVAGPATSSYRIGHCLAFLPKPAPILGCSHRAALTAVDRSRIPLEEKQEAHGVFGRMSLRCPDFTSDGNADLVVEFHSAGDISAWAAFRRTRHDWEPVLFHTGDGIRVSRAGHDLVESRLVCPHHASDCSKHRVEHRRYDWNGRRLVLVATSITG